LRYVGAGCQIRRPQAPGSSTAGRVALLRRVVLGQRGGMRVKDAVGRFGEDLAATYLCDAGLTIVERNWRCPDGELDIVARDGEVLIFVEVKTRSSTAFGDPAEAVNPVKALRLRKLALRWLAEHRDVPYWSQLRFDVIAVLRLAPGGPSVRHLKAVL
jgi:putative endonuclease